MLLVFIVDFGVQWFVFVMQVMIVWGGQFVECIVCCEFEVVLVFFVCEMVLLVQVEGVWLLVIWFVVVGCKGDWLCCSYWFVDCYVCGWVFNLDGCGFCVGLWCVFDVQGLLMLVMFDVYGCDL